MLLANTFRWTGMGLLIVGSLILLGYLLYNYIVGREEVGAEIELAPNKKPYLDDEELETKKLDMSLTMGLGLLAVIGLGLPLYWLGEPGRQSGYVEFTQGQLTSRGGELYEANCSACHGPGAVGGVAPFTVLDEEGRFVASVSWKAPSLTAAMYRFSSEELRYILDYGRTNSPMPAWGAPGGGPLTSQQIDELILYIMEIQLSPEELAEDVESGLKTQVRDQINDAARAEVLASNPDLADPEMAAELSEAVMEEVGGEEALDAMVESEFEGLSEAELGELVFNNPAAEGAYNCARCHTAGWSWDSDTVAVDPEQPFGSLIQLQVSGGGGFGPNLTGGATLRQFPSGEDHMTFVGAGSEDGIAYGEFGQGDGGGQMPGFGGCIGDRDAADFSPYEDFCAIEVDGVVEDRGGTLTQEQLDAVVEYERGL